MERHINPRLPARLTVTVTPSWLRTIQLRQRPTISIKSSFLLPRQRVLVAQTERLRLISGDPPGPRRVQSICQGHRQTSASNSMAMVFWSVEKRRISGGRLAQARRAPVCESRPPPLPQRQRLPARSVAASIVELLVSESGP